MSMIGVDYGVLNQKGSPSWFSDIYANIPTAGYKGRMFISIDTYAFYRDTGTGWDLIGGPGTGTITGSGTSGQVSYFNGSSTLAGSNNLFWDITNSRLGIGTATPGASLDIHSTGTNAQFNGTGTNNAYLVFQNAGTSKWRIGNTYNAGANSFDIYNNGLASTPLSISSTTNQITLTSQLNGTDSVFSGSVSSLSILLNSVGSASQTFIKNVNATGVISTGANQIGFNINNALYISADNKGCSLFSFNHGSSTYTYTLPSVTGTIALTSNLSSYLPLTGGTLTGNLITNSYISIQNGLGTNQIYLTKSSGDVYGTIQTEAGGNKFSLGNVSNIGTLGTPNITWTSGAQVGINNSSPTYDFDVTGTGRFTSTLLLGGALSGTSATFSGSVGIGVSSFANSLSVGLDMSGGAGLFGFNNRFILTANAYYNVDWKYKATGYAAVIQSNTDGSIDFLNAASGTINNSISFSTRMVITSGGYVNIGGTAYSQGLSGYNLALFGASPMLKFQGSGHAWDMYQSTPQLYFAYDSVDKAYINATTGAFIPVSDINKKKDFELSTIGLQAILNLKPTLYKMLNDEQNVNKHLGFIAQEVKEFIPQAYCETKNNEKTFIGLDYQAITSVIVKAIQELNEKLVKNNIN